MSDRFYRASLGLSLLLCLYFDLRPVLIAIIILVFLEGISNYRLPRVARMIRSASLETPEGQRVFGFEAERAWRLVVACALTLAVIFFPEQLWWFAWFMGFAIFGAGLSGLCPMLITLQKLGFQ